MPARPWSNALDMYRKVPTDLLEGTRRGSAMSYLCILSMALLAYLETRAFFTTSLAKDLALDANRDSRVRVNFNVTMMDLKCDYATIDVVSVLGTDQNVTQHVTKFGVDAEGVRKRFAGRNKQQDDVAHFDEQVKETIEELHENGEDAVSLDPQTLTFARNENEFLFVDFYASWCSHCRDLAPTWEVLAEVMMDAASAKLNSKIEGREHEYSEKDYEEAVKLELPVFIGKVDCVSHQALCMEQNIRGYPTLRLFHDGKYYADYRGHREVVEMTHWLTNMEERVQKEKPKDDGEEGSGISSADNIARDRMGVEESREDMKQAPRRPGRRGSTDSPEEKEWVEKMNRHRTRQKAEWNDEEHPGCQLSGFLMLDRAPGHFRIQARSINHDIAAHMTNVSHEIHHLSFGDPGAVKSLERSGSDIFPPGFIESTTPMDGNVYVTHNVHEAHHHYLKVITTELDHEDYKPSMGASRRAYTVLQSSQLSFFRNDIVPEARFTYDLSPIAVSFRKKSRRWYDYLTSLMAIVGGTFTIFGILESGVGAVSGKKRR
uniref:Thioredoxin domain-containing protein n=1 Tax=Trieres chinensis TaxID=1514140 RepID=A0A7S2ELW4_TRICV